MTEAQIGYLCKAASALHHAENNPNLALLRKFYLMRCKELTKGFGLPQKQFSSKVRCTHCCSEWNKASEVQVRSIKLSKQQRRRLIRNMKNNKKQKDYVNGRKELYSNEMEQICTFCKHSTLTLIKKPEKLENKLITTNILITREKDKVPKVETIVIKNVKNQGSKKDIKPINSQKIKQKLERDNEAIDVYNATKQAFSLSNSKNMLANAIKEAPKVIKNNKKKKDKFAGLCQKAVLAATKFKQESEKQSKLNLFLRPST